jgi:hypothetical protein
MSTFLVVETPTRAVTGVEVDPHMVAEMMEDIGKEVSVLEGVRLLRMQTSRFLVETLEMFRMFRSFSWNNWIETLFLGLKVRCGVVVLR